MFPPVFEYCSTCFQRALGSICLVLITTIKNNKSLLVIFCWCWSSWPAEWRQEVHRDVKWHEKGGSRLGKGKLFGMPLKLCWLNVRCNLSVCFQRGSWRRVITFSMPKHFQKELFGNTFAYLFHPFPVRTAYVKCVLSCRFWQGLEGRRLSQRLWFFVFFRSLPRRMLGAVLWICCRF